MHAPTARALGSGPFHRFSLYESNILTMLGMQDVLCFFTQMTIHRVVKSEESVFARTFTIVSLPPLFRMLYSQVT
jgi:hypothetical protein